MGTDHDWIWQQREWPDFLFDVNQLLPLLTALSRRIGGLEMTCQALAGQQLLDVRENTLVDDAMETSAIEGEVLRRSAVRASIRKQLGLPVELDDSTRDTDGLVTMLIDARERAGAPLTEERLCGWHASLFPFGFSGLHRIRVGSYRGEEEMRIISGPVGRERVHYVAPPRNRLHQEMNRFLEWLESGQPPDEPLLRAGISHLWFIMIHPFDDGNGRLARAITDFILARAFPSLMQIISFSKHVNQDCKGYYDVLETAGRGGMEITAWLSWFLETLHKTLDDSEWLIGQVVGKARFWEVHRGTDFNGRQQKVLTRLLEAGDRFLGGMTPRKYAGMCKCSRVTASRDLANLETKGAIRKRVGGGRSTSYEIFMPQDG